VSGLTLGSWRREWVVIGLVAILPIPLLALSGAGLPLPSVIERGFSAILPGSTATPSPAQHGSKTISTVRGTPKASVPKVAPAVSHAATATRPKAHSTKQQVTTHAPTVPTADDPATAPGGTTAGGVAQPGPIGGTHAGAPGTSGTGSSGGSGGSSDGTAANAGAGIGVSAGGASVGVSTSNTGGDTTGSDTTVGASTPDGTTVGASTSTSSSGSSSTTVGASNSDGTSTGVTVGTSDSGASVGVDAGGTSVTVPLP
jgi:hypothetical protein